ncbi:MAG: DUF2807 domain-containing protein, partial [Flammeovirgaceae bacterium]|nr:DUF2807 domain-containing protein [Flammeovirgaceae bacterium]MDW8287843.1 DUF2807 domain-containing protein [Flammeovirgaceae bacterium]
HIEGNYIVRILPADSYEVKAICGKDIHRINLVQEDGRLIISEKENDDRYIQLVIRVRELEEIALGGKVRAKLDGLKEKNLHISLWDSASLEALVTTDSLVAHLSAYSRLVLTGKSETFEAFLTGTSEVVAEGFPVEKVSIEASDISKVNVNALQEIQINRSSNSLVDYVGKPQKIFIHQE